MTTVAVVLDGGLEVVRVCKTKKGAKDSLTKVKVYQELHEEEFNDHWYMDIEVEDCTIQMYQVWDE